MLRIGVDTGGTFTDFVWFADGARQAHKVPSTPDDPSRAVLTGLRQLMDDGKLPAGTAVVHGSTVATNALLEGKGAAVALLTNRGFEDLLEIGRQARPALYDASVFPSPPLVPATRRLGVGGRLGPGGEEIEPLDGAAVEAAVREMMAQGVHRFAICFLHSYADSAHEEEAGRLVRRLGATASLSSAILPEHREFERASTTVVNASLSPVMAAYLARLESALSGARLSIFRSNGGILSARAAGEEAVQTLLSGPAAGVIGAVQWGRRSGLSRLITFDMGGTSTDVCLCDGAAAVTTEADVAGYPVRVPMIDIHTVGAGGGSIARAASGGALLVGPESAGADPGPACYGRGTQATVTDAQLALGRLQPERFLGGRMTLDPERAMAAIDALAASLGLSRERTAAGIVEVATTSMERAVRVVSVARGHDPREFSLFCFGGAGGLHAADLAAGLGIPEVVVPPEAGTFSALGMMAADVVRDASRGVLRPLSSVPRQERGRLAAEMEGQLSREMVGESFDGPLIFTCSLDLRYAGQSFELTVPEGDDPAAAFHDLHGARYGHARQEVEVELVTLRVRAVGRVSAPEAGAESKTTAEAVSQSVPPAAPDDEAPVWFTGGSLPTPIFLRQGLQSGHRLTGPAVVSEPGSTTVVPPGWSCQVDGSSNLRLHRAAALEGAKP